ncbi:MAG: hypothetical protein P4L76_04300 [Beijerinckiaceae bacterium]|nr:hypothetical protein [Beijerinckiaceae bacterium]
MTACGYTSQQIDAMAMGDVLDLLRYWRNAPPVHEILAAVYQIAPVTATPKSASDPSGIGDLIARYPNGSVKPS